MILTSLMKFQQTEMKGTQFWVRMPSYGSENTWNIGLRAAHIGRENYKKDCVY